MTKEILGTDLKLIPRVKFDGWDLSTAGKNGFADLAPVSGEDNLVQALSLRLCMPRGTLAPLGHPNYGSRLGELIGRPNDSITRQLLKIYCQDCIRQEPRVKEIQKIEVETTAATGRVDIHVQVIPVDSNTPLNLVFPFNLEG
jgi:phage baseplate assembly protein W